MLPPYSTLASIAWRQYLNRFDVVLFGHLLFSLPVIVGLAYIKRWWPLPQGEVPLEQYVPNLPIQLGLDYLGSLITCITAVLLILAMQHAVRRKSVPLKTLLKEAMRLYPAAILLTLLELVLTVVGLAFFIVPGLLASVVLSLAMPALVWQRTTPWQALRLSWQAMRGHFWKTVSYIVFTQLLVSLVLLLINWGLPINFGFTVFSSFMAAICSSYYITFTTILYTATTSLVSATPPSAEGGSASGGEAPTEPKL